MKSFLSAALLLAAITGCGPEGGQATYPVEGSVTLDGAPLSNGDIILDPMDGAGPSASGPIREGTFNLQSTAGKKRVEIRASRETGEIDELAGLPVLEEMIPARYNVDSKLVTTISAEGKNQLEFALQSSPP